MVSDAMLLDSYMKYYGHVYIFFIFQSIYVLQLALNFKLNKVPNKIIKFNPGEQIFFGN